MANSLNRIVQTGLWSRLCRADKGDLASLQHDDLHFFRSWSGVEELRGSVKETASDLSAEKWISILNGIYAQAFRSLTSTAHNAADEAWIHIWAVLSRVRNEVYARAIPSRGNWQCLPLLGQLRAQLEGPREAAVDAFAILTEYSHLRAPLLLDLLATVDSTEFHSFTNFLVGSLTDANALSRSLLDFNAELGFPACKNAILAHLLASALSGYEDAGLSRRSSLSIPIVTLLGQMFDDPVHTMSFRHSFWAGDLQRGVVRAPYDALVDVYEELEHLEEFARHARRNRSPLLASIKELSKYKSNDFVERAPRLGEVVSDVLHTDLNSVYYRQSLRKATNISQITCLVRVGRTVSGSGPRPYQEWFGPYSLRYATLDSAGKWKTEAPKDSQKLNWFKKAIDDVFMEGWKPETLRMLFQSDAISSGTSTDERRNADYVWISDGEFAFFLLLVILAKARTQHGITAFQWIGAQGAPVTLTCSDIAPPDCQLRSISWERTSDDFSHFITEMCPLFSRINEQPLEPLQPTARFWALYDFLTRCATREIDSYGRLADGIEAFLRGLSEQAARPIYCAFEDALRAAITSQSLDKLIVGGVDTIKREMRLPSLLLELILREGESAPRTLFFAPLMFEPDQVGTLVPMAFLAGTFMKLEGVGGPFVSARNDAHLVRVLDALRPAIDLAVGRQLQKDEEAIRHQSERADQERQNYDRVAHLAGVEREANALIRKLDDVIGTANRIRTSIAPASAGPFAGLQDLDILFESRKAVWLAVGGLKDTNNADSVAWARAKLEDGVLDWEPEWSLSLGLDRPASTFARQFETFHSERELDNSAFLDRWKDYLPTLFVLGKHLGNLFLPSFAKAAWKHRDDFDVSRRLFHFLKIVLHRSRYPDSCSESVSRDAILYDIQLVWTAIEAVKSLRRPCAVEAWNRTFAAPEDLVDFVVKDAAGLYIPNLLTLPRSRQQYTLLPPHSRPANAVLDPLFLLLARELAWNGGSTGSGHVFATRIRVLHDVPNELRLIIYCQQRLAVEGLHRGRAAGGHGLSGTLRRLARGVGALAFSPQVWAHCSEPELLERARVHDCGDHRLVVAVSPEQKPDSSKGEAAPVAYTALLLRLPRLKTEPLAPTDGLCTERTMQLAPSALTDPERRHGVEIRHG